MPAEDLICLRVPQPHDDGGASVIDEVVVASAQGAPSHVLFDDDEAEHLPGCNLAVRKEVLEAIGGFSERYLIAGDDVDFCWRLQQAGFRMGFSAAAFVWHEDVQRCGVISRSNINMARRRHC